MSEERPPPRRKGGPTLGPKMNISVPISFGLPLLVGGVAMLITASNSEGSLLWILGGVALVAGVALMMSGKSL